MLMKHLRAVSYIMRVRVSRVSNIHGAQRAEERGFRVWERCVPIAQEL